MTRRTFTTSMTVIGLLAGAALVVLYMTLGHLQAAFESTRPSRQGSSEAPAQPATGGEVPGAAGSAPGSTQGAATPGSTMPPPADMSIEAQLAAQGLSNMTLTPAGRAELMRLERKQQMTAPKPAAAPVAAPKPEVPGDATTAATTTKPAPEQPSAP